MTIIIPFVPSNIRRFSFQAVFDDINCKVETTWNVSAQRYYINVYTSDGTWLLTVPLIQSPPARDINSVSYDPFRLRLIIQMVDPSLWAIPLSPAGILTAPGTVIDYTLEKFQPTIFNGTYRGMHINTVTFEVPMKVDPGPTVRLGTVSRYLNMIASIFKTSTLIYRSGAFEVGP